MADRRFVTVDDGYLFPTPLEARLGAKITTAKTDAISDATTKYGGLPSRVAVTEARTESITPAEDDGFRVRDAHGSVALEVSADGTTGFAGSKHRASDAPYRVVDAQGRVALEVDSQGRTHIYDQATGGGGVQQVTDLHVFVAAGQSNMSGRGEPTSPELDPPSPRIMQFGSKRRVLETATVPLDMHDEPFGLSPATVFSREYLLNQPPNVGVLIVPVAHGGTGFTHAETTDGLTWSKGKATNPDNALYEKSVVTTLEALDAADNAGYTATLKGVLWHQGEGNGGMQTAAYATQLDKLIGDYRTELGVANLPFIVGQMMPEGMLASPSKYTVDRAHVETPARVTRSGFAPSSWDTARFNDTAHFGRDGVSDMGIAMVRGYQQAVSNIPTNRPYRPLNVRAEKRGGVLRVTWDAPLSRVTGYKVEYQVNSGAWVEVVRDWPMYLHEEVDSVPSGAIGVRVTALEGAIESTPSTPLIAIGA